MKPKTTLILLSVLIVLGLAVGIAKLIQRFPKTQASAPRRVLPDTPSKPASLTLESRDGQKIAFQYESGHWRMTEPQAMPADDDAVEELVQLMRDLEYVREYTPDGRAETPPDAESGLDRPLWTLTLTGSDGSACALQVGRSAPKVGGSGEETYVRPAGDKRTLVVARDLAPTLRRDIRDYRDKDILKGLQAENVTAILVEGRQNYALRKGRDNWRLAKPFAAKVQNMEVDSLARRLADLKAQRVLADRAEDLKDYGLDQPQLVIRVTAQESPAPSAEATSKPAPKYETFVLQLGNIRGEYICAKAANRPEIFALEKSTLDDLQPKLESLLSKNVLAVDVGDVDRLEIRRGQEAILLEKQKDQWRMTRPYQGPADELAVQAVLQRLVDLRAQRWIAPQITGGVEIASPTAVVSAHLAGDDSTVELRIGARDAEGKNYYCQQAGAPLAAVVAAEDIDELLPPARRLWSKQILQIEPKAKAVALTLLRQDGEFVLVRRADQWMLAAPVSEPVETRAVNDVLAKLRDLRADAIESLGPKLGDNFAKASERVTVTLTTLSQDQASRQTYRLAVVKINDGCFAWLEGQTPVAVGRLDGDLYRALTQKLTASSAK